MTIKERKEIIIEATTLVKLHEKKREIMNKGFTVKEPVYFNYSTGEHQITMQTEFKEIEL